MEVVGVEVQQRGWPSRGTERTKIINGVHSHFPTHYISVISCSAEKKITLRSLEFIFFLCTQNIVLQD